MFVKQLNLLLFALRFEVQTNTKLDKTLSDSLLPEHFFDSFLHIKTHTFDLQYAHTKIKENI